jgi:hypothetical protein
LGRAVTEVPVSLGWRIVQSPVADRLIDAEAVIQAGFHLLLLGGDIRAPIGQEWVIARRAGRLPVCLLKSGIPRTPAAQSFARFIKEQTAWQAFRDTADLRTTVLNHLARHLLRRIDYYAMTPVEVASLQSWQAELEESSRSAAGEVGGAGESGVVLSPERYVPSEGILFSGSQDNLRDS